MDANGELTAAELVLLRTRPQRTDLYLAIPTYATVYTAVVVAPVPASNDGVYEVTFDGGAGATWADVVAGMTLMVGTLAGGSDIGFARIRDVITTADAGITGTIDIGTTSEIDFAVGQFLTVTNEFGLWPRHPYVDPATGEEFMDWDIDYDTVGDPQHVYFAPVPVMYPSAVVELTGASVSVAFDALASWVPGTAPGGYTYLWTCAGANPIVPDNLPGATITFTTAGTYLVVLEMSADYAGGHSPVSFGYRYVIVYDDAHPLIKSPVLESCSGDFDNGGWSYRVTCHSQAGLTTIHNRTLCMLVADDWYGATKQSIGPIAGRENIICIGWIDGESITWSNDTGNVSFDVQGPQWWLDRMPGYPTGVDDALVASVAWTEIETLTARKGLWHFLYWRTTAAAVMDIPSVARHGFTTPDARRLATTYTPSGSLWEQLRAIADRIFARATCDRYGRLFINVDNQLVDPAIRGTHPNILGAGGFTDADWRDEITIERLTVPDAALVDLSGVYWSGTVATSSALFSLAPGHYFKHYGRPAPRDRLALTDQAESNMLAGLYLGWLNNEYPHVDVPLAANNRCFDIAPYQFSWMSIAAGDTPRGIEWTNKRLIPRRVSFERDTREAVLLADVTFEAETFANTAMIGDPPIEPPVPDPTDPPLPPCICDDPTAINYGGDCPCVYPANADVIIVMTKTQMGRSLNFFDAVPVWEDISTGLSGDYFQICVNPVGEAWCVTSDGFYYCADVSAAAPAWSLRMALATARAWDAAFAAANFGSCFCDPAGVGWTMLTGVTMPVTQAIQFVQDNARVQLTPAVPLNGVYATPYQYAMSASVASLRCATGYAGGANYFSYINVPGGTGDNDTVGYRECFLLSSLGAYAINEGRRMVAIPDMDTVVQDEIDYLRPVVELGANFLWSKFGATPPGKTGDLMIDGIVQAIPCDDGVDTGVFGSAVDAPVGGGYMFVDSSGHILWVSGSPAASNTYRSIAYTEDGGVTWQTKDGNIAAALGAWTGIDGGTIPVVARYSY